MEEFVVSRAEREGHIEFFESRQKIWDFMKDESCLYDLCTVMKEKHHELCSDYVKRRKDGLIHLQIEWNKWLSHHVDEKMIQFASEKMAEKDARVHCRVLVRTVGKYVVAYLKKKEDDTIATKRCSKKLLKKAKTVVTKQPDYGLQVLAGGILGNMFRLYKRNPKKYSGQYTILRKMIVQNKTGEDIPVQQRARDRGGLYIIKPVFLPLIRVLDGQIREEFAHTKKHGRAIIKVVRQKVRAAATQKLTHTCHQLVTSDTSEELIRDVCTTFIRKYTHARIGGHIKGKQERDSEKRGVRSKGGCSLRDKLYNVSGGSKRSKAQAKNKTK